MLIRTQDKNGLVNLDRIELLTTSGGKDITAYFAHFAGMQSQTLGVYSSEKKAIKVLNQIQQHYEIYERAKYYPDELAVFPVFEMPQDTEVKA